jgi:ATP-binding cassette subfamily B protein
MLVVFLVLIVVDAVIGAANPLIYREIIDVGIFHHRIRLIEGLALLVGVLALADAGLTLGQRWVSARIGEGLIFDMRAKVFAHIQKMPLAFFTRTQTGSLVSRLNNDVLGAQQAFTDTFNSVVSNVIGVTITLGVHVLPVVADHPGRPGPAADLPRPGPIRGPTTGRHHP